MLAQLHHIESRLMQLTQLEPDGQDLKCCEVIGIGEQLFSVACHQLLYK